MTSDLSALGRTALVPEALRPHPAPMSNDAVTQLNVLLVETGPHDGDRAAAQLRQAGHVVHRCYDEDAADFPCHALVEPDTCPLDGHIDVAVLARRPHEPLPTRREEGIACAIRAGVPIVEEGSERMDPFAPWVTTRVPQGSDNVAQACVRAVDTADQPLRLAIRRTIAPAVQAAGMDPSDVRCSLAHHGPAMDVHVQLPGPATIALQSAISVRVLDAVRAAATRTVGNVDVFVHPTG